MDTYYDGAFSLNKDTKSPYWFVSYSTPDGKKRRRSTKVPHQGGTYKGERISSKLAEKIAYQVGMNLANTHTQEYVAQNNISVRELCLAYNKRREGLVSQRTFTNANTAYRFFFEFLGSRADAPARLITKADIKDYIYARKEEVRKKTVMKDFDAIKQAFSDAYDSDIINKNPCAGVTIPPDKPSEKFQKEALSMDDIRYIIDKFPASWASAVRCSYHTCGQRLGDILALDWSQVNWEQRCILFKTGKVGKFIQQPMRGEFHSWLKDRWENEGCPSKGLLHPTLLALGDGASAQFGALMKAHGIGRVQDAGGGRRKSRNTKTFHSIRATCATLLQTQGISEGIAMQLVGHDSKDIHAAYIVPSSDQLRDAVNALPPL